MHSAENVPLLDDVPSEADPAVPARPQEPNAVVRLWCAALAVVVAAGAVAEIGADRDALAAVAFVFVLGIITAVDLEQMRVPNRIVLPAAAVALLWQLAFHRSDLGEVALAGAGAGLVFLVAFVATRGAVGMGDAKLALLIGIVLGSDVVTALFFATLAGAVGAVAILVRRGSEARKAPMPYAPFLAAGAVIALLVGSSSPLLH
jgi:prepilin signal peptidase PulO-like enzyme (type II secretory pathway)